MELSQARSIYEKIFTGVDGFSLSYAWQQLDRGDKERDRNLTYGEIDFEGFFQILYDVPGIVERQVFYDLGSGVGKAVIAAALLGNFKEVVGIELLPPLHEQAIVVSKLWEKEKITELPKVKFLQEDFLEATDYSNVDLVYIHCTCFSQRLMYLLEDVLQTLPTGAIVLTVSQSLPRMEIVKTKKYPFRWGEGTVYSHLKS